MLKQNMKIQAAPGTVFYNPWYQFAIRILLGISAAIYYYFLPVPFLVLNGYIICFILITYFIFHIFWWLRFLKIGINQSSIRLANWVDLIASAITVTVDPYLIPPTIVLILITVIGNGIQHGLENFIVVSKNALLVFLVSTQLHFLFLQKWPPYSFYFLSIFLLVTAHYAYNLVSRIEQLKNQAENMAQYDELTGLMNRRAFLISAKYIVSLHNRTDMSLVFVFADLDGFKKVNDRFGHATGDLLLKHMGELIRNTFRESDITARFGGDEFVFILPNSNFTEAQNVLSRLETELINWANTKNIRIGISFGIKEVSEDKIVLEDIMKVADDALYEEKRNKKNR